MAFKKEQSFTSTIIKIAIFSTALSIAVMILSSAILEGFSREIHSKIFGFWGNIHVNNAGITRDFELRPFSIDEDFYAELKEIESIDYQEVNDGLNGNTPQVKRTSGGVKSVHPYIIMPGLIETNNVFQAILLKGVDGAFDWSQMSQFLIDGKSIDFEKVENDIIISKNLAERLELKTGNQVLLGFIKERSKIRRKVKIAGVYNTGLEEYDRRMIIGSMAMLQDILDWERTEVSGLEVFVDDPNDNKVLAEYIYEEILPLDLYAEPIEDKFPSIFEWLKLQDINDVVIFYLMVLVAIVNLITIVLIIVLERTEMIGILKAIGATNWSIKKIFLFNASYILLLGLLLGNILGLGLAALQQKYKFIKLDEASYYLDTAPIYIDWMKIVFINLGSVSMIMLALLIPLIVISRLTPTKALRFN